MEAEPEPYAARAEDAEPAVEPRQPLRPSGERASDPMPEPATGGVLTATGDGSATQRKTGGVDRLARTTVPLAASLAAIALAALAGLLLSQLRADDEPTVATTSAGPLEVQVPEGWRRDYTIPRIGAVSLERPVAIEPPAGGAIVAGVVQGSDVAIDPGRVARAAAGSRSAATAVRLGSFEALRWQGIRARNSNRTLDLYVAPTTRGSLTVACLGAEARGDCARTAASIRFEGARGYSPVRAARWREAVRSQMADLRRRRKAGSRRLSEARTRRAQARGATSLATVHARAARALGAPPAPPQASGAQRDLVAALGRLERSYQDLAAAIGRGDSGRFRAARGSLQRQEAALRRVLRSI